MKPRPATIDPSVESRPSSPSAEREDTHLHVSPHSHVACIWETDEQLTTAVDFAADGLRGSDHCVVVGDPEDNLRVLRVLEKAGLDVGALQAERRLALLEQASAARQMLSSIERALAQTVAAGAHHVRLLCSVGWGGRPTRPDGELFLFESRLTDLAREFPCAILCVHDLRSMDAQTLRHGVLGTHPEVCGHFGVEPQPLFEPLDRSEDRLQTIAAMLSARQRERNETRRQEEVLRAMFDNSPIMVSFYDAAGRLLLVNQSWERAFGWTVEDAQRIDLLAAAYPDPVLRQEVLEFIRNPGQGWRDFQVRTRDGRVLDTLWARVVLSDGTSIGFGQDVTERRMAVDQLEQSHRELRALSERLRRVREEEGVRIAREVHDEVGQMLTALSMDIAWLVPKLELMPSPEREEVAGKVRILARLIDSTMDAVQRITTELRPGVLDELGLEAAIEWYAAEFQKRTGVTCNLRSNMAVAKLDNARTTALFRILQEALTNVARHADATRVEIRLSVEPDRAVLAVTDDGRGIPGDRIADSRSLGLLGMRERAKYLGGDVQIMRAGDRGTVVEVVMPL